MLPPSRAHHLWTLLLLAAGCSPIIVRYDGDPAPVGVGPSTTTPNSLPDDLQPARVLPPRIRQVTCDQPELRGELGAFVREVTSARGANTDNWLWASGILAGDLDGDGIVDFVAPSEGGATLFRGRVNEAPRARDDLGGLELTMGVGGSVADFDADGDLDLLVLRYDEPVSLLRNDGPGRFTDVTAQAGVDVVGPSMSSAWADYDADGDLDLFVAGYGYVYGDTASPSPSSLLRNNGDGSFEDMSHLLPPAVREAYTLSASWQDLDGDGWLDLYLVNDIGHVVPNMVLHNQPHPTGHRFVAGTLAPALALATSGTGLATADINGDKLPDFLIPQWDNLSLMLSHGELGVWSDHANALGMQADPDRGQAVGWGAELADVDNDGDLDAVVAFGHAAIDGPGWGNPHDQPDALYLQADDGTFADVADDPWWSVDDRGAQRGIVVDDFNGDGWLDIAKRDLEGSDVLYLSRCGEAAWLQVQLSAAGANSHAIGARVDVLLEDGSELTRWVRSGGTGFGSGGAPWVHFGLGDAEVVRRVTVNWPDGLQSQFDDLPTHSIVTIDRLDDPSCRRQHCAP